MNSVDLVLAFIEVLINNKVKDKSKQIPLCGYNRNIKTIFSMV